jgi:GH15 family glucan-1,4-alpha-glucosidase
MTSGYVPISDYALIADGHTAALVSRTGSIDWCCLPRFDAESCFGRVLDAKRGGYFSITPAEKFTAAREYLEGGLVLQTTFTTRTGQARLTDFFSMRKGGREDPRRELVRIVEGVKGTVAFDVRIVPRFVYGALAPWIRNHRPGTWTATGSDQALVFVTDANIKMEGRHELAGRAIVRNGKGFCVRTTFVRPEKVESGVGTIARRTSAQRRLEETLTWWRTWLAKGTSEDEGVRRSSAVLKALTYAPTGAGVAAPTTSLPESLHGDRNWDYRFSWVRDSCFAAEALLAAGHDAMAGGFRRFTERCAAGDASELQIMYGIGGEARLTETIVDGLEGYRGIGPVRSGNAAHEQAQFDVYGQLMGLASVWLNQGHRPDDDYWSFLTDVVEIVCDRWSRPDRGIWEVRSDPEHFVHSKASCWNAVKTGIRMAERTKRKAPVKKWTKVRDEIKAAIESDGYDNKRGIFVRSFGSRELDAALLLLPMIGIVRYDDDRMVRTTDAIREELDADGLLLRYKTEDSLSGEQVPFLPCSFWLVRCLARQGRVADAREVYDRAVATSNDLGLFAEMYDTKTEQMLGNFPQALTHLSHITATLALRRAEG